MAIPETRNLSYQGANLPQVTEADDGKVLGVVGGKWVAKDDESGSVLPETTAADVGKSLMVDADGNWGKDSETVTITLSEEEQAAVESVVTEAQTAAVQDSGVKYYSARSGGMSEATHNRILEIYNAGKSVKVGFSVNGLSLIATPAMRVSVGGKIGMLALSFSGVMEGITPVDVQISMFGTYDEDSETMQRVFVSRVSAVLCIPKLAD